MNKLRHLASRAWHGIVLYALKFGVVGLIGFAIDTGLFNLLRLEVFGEGWWSTALGAKVLSTSVAIVFNWIGNRYWTFREHRRKNFVLEMLEYIVVAVGGLLISLLCLWVSHHLLGYDNIIADNISANVIGLVLGTIFRFLLYRYWVYGMHRGDGLSARARVEEGQRSLFEEPGRPVDDSSDPSAAGAHGAARP